MLYINIMSLLDVLKICFSRNVLDLCFLVLFSYKRRLWLKEAGSGSW